jgi:hypothetical protein
MRLIALRGFKNNAKALIKFERGSEPVHADGVHAGAIFTIGDEAPVSELPEAYKYIIGQLAQAKCIGDASDEKLVKRVQAEVKADKARAEEQANLVAAGSHADVARQVASVLADYGLIPKKGGNSRLAEAMVPA